MLNYFAFTQKILKRSNSCLIGLAYEIGDKKSPFLENKVFPKFKLLKMVVVPLMFLNETSKIDFGNQICL